MGILKKCSAKGNPNKQAFENRVLNSFGMYPSTGNNRGHHKIIACLHLSVTRFAEPCAGLVAVEAKIVGSKVLPVWHQLSAHVCFKSRGCGNYHHKELSSPLYGLYRSCLSASTAGSTIRTRRYSISISVLQWHGCRWESCTCTLKALHNMLFAAWTSNGGKKATDVQVRDRDYFRVF